MNLWAITCLFNPAGYCVRPKNYHRFRERLPLPLVTVELAYEDGFSLAEGDADILLRRTGGARLWQKEALLNIALEALPDECDAVVAIDADVVFREPAWTDLVAAALENYPIMQPYMNAYDVDGEGRELYHRQSASSMWPREDGRLKRMGPQDEVTGTHISNGLVWAARRDVLDRHGFYDGCIIGGGDTALICALSGSQEVVVDRHRMGIGQEERYRRWADPVAEQIKGQVGFLPLDIEHLWHGKFENRLWMERHAKLRDAGFDPNADVRRRHDGVLQWATERPELHELVRSYFIGRQEDAPAAPVGAPVLIAQSPPVAPHPYTVILSWIQQKHPELARHFDIALLPAKLNAGSKAVVFWLSDPTEFFNPPLHDQALQLEAEATQLGLPIHNRPSCQANVGKLAAHGRLRAAGIFAPNIAPIEIGGEAPDLSYPFIVRDDVGHGGEFRLIEKPEDLRCLNREDFFRPVASEFVDVRSEDGRYRKFRAIVVGGSVVSHHLQTSNIWLTRGANRINDLQTREEEIEYVSNPDAFSDLMLRVSKALELEFLGIDYSIDREGRVVIWEANPFPHLHFSKAVLMYRNFAMERTIAAIVRESLLLAGVEPSRKLERQASFES